MARGAAVAALAAAMSAGLAGCGAGQISRTAETEPSIVGVNVDAPDQSVLIRDAAVAFPGPEGYPAGARAPITMVIFNETPTAVRLLQARSELGPVTIEPPGASPAAPGPTGTPGASPTASPSPEATAGPEATASPAAAQSPSPTAPAPGPSGLTIPASGFAQVTVVVERLEQAVGPTDDVPLELVFDTVAVGPFQVPIATPREPLPRETP